LKRFVLVANYARRSTASSRLGMTDAEGASANTGGVYGD
jgi:hypothetical protein